jgi:hypothetical protein
MVWSQLISVQDVKIIMDSQVTRKTENTVCPEVLLKPDRERLLCGIVFHCLLLYFLFQVFHILMFMIIYYII